MKIFKKFLKVLGPGLITGGSDDDPSGIATYSQTGAQFGYTQLWLAFYLLPFLIAIQESCARIGAVTEHGITGVLKKHYNNALIFVIVLLLFLANVINIGANILAMADAFSLLIPINIMVMSFIFVALILTMEILFSYRIYSNLLKWLCIFLFAYLVELFFVKLPWSTLLQSTFIPYFKFQFDYLFILVAIIGTTISPYLFFWQASQVVEEKKTTFLRKKRFVFKLRLDNLIGMLSSEVVTWSIIVLSSATLHTHGITDIKNAADAAKALEPLVQSFQGAGYLSKALFAFGIVGLGLISVPVLAGSAAYAFGELFKWKIGLNLKLKRAPEFYGIIILGMILSLLINLTKIDPFKALVYSAVINGIISMPLLAMIALTARNKKILGKYRSGILSSFLVWGAFLLVILAIFITLILYLRKSL